MKGFLLFIIIFIAILLGGCAVASQSAPVGRLATLMLTYNDSGYQTTEPGQVTFLVLGLDRRSKSEPTRSDGMMLVNVNVEHGRVSILSIPRDLWVTVPGYGEDRINTAFFYGELEDGESGGGKLAMETVAQNFNVPVDHFVALDFHAFQTLVDDVGGIDINVPREIRDDQYPDNNYGYKSIYIPAGAQHMNGELALEYGRTRHADSDLGRNQRQAQLAQAFIKAALQPQILVRLPQLAHDVQTLVETDMAPREMVWSLLLARQVNPHNLVTQRIGETEVSRWITPQGADVLRPNWAAIHKTVVEWQNPSKTSNNR
ncbi:MAG: LytR family transcriptional regulator [Chloroflexi bacterium]|nr:LytR family transcriptional regulator [Chloroflexota bacterium]